MIITVVLKDAYSRRTTKMVETTSTTLADALTDAEDLASALEAVSTCGVAAYTISEKGERVPTTAAGSNLDAGATIHCRLDNGKVFPFKVPGIETTLLNADGTVKISDPSVLALIDLFESTGNLRVSEGDVIAAIERGELDR